MANDIYVYFDRQGVLKERIAAPIRAYARGNRLLAYVEGDSDGSSYSYVTVSFRKIGTPEWAAERATGEYGYIPTNVSDTLYFSKTKRYRFNAIQIPGYVLDNPGNWEARFDYHASDGRIAVTGNATFEVEGGQPAIGSEITIDQYYELVDKIGRCADGKPYESLVRKADYLYEITFNELPTYKVPETIPTGGCSSFVKDGKLYRNLDWTYDEGAEFIVRFKNVVGMSFIKGLNDGEPFDEEKLGQLPYRVCDGVNSSGVMVATHVLYNDFGFEGSGERDTDITLLPHLVLTTMTSVGTLSAEVSHALGNLRIPDGLAAIGMLIQILVTDGTSTKLITPKNDGSGYEYVDITSRPQLTNFKWVNRADVAKSDSDLQDRPTGIERWNLITAGTTLKELRFTKAYETPSRLSEFIGERETTKESSDAELTEIYEIAHSMYETRQRDGELWQTVHSVVYSADGMESLFVQENYGRDIIASGGSKIDYSEDLEAGTITLFRI